MRSMAGRSSGSSRRYSIKPVGLPMGVRIHISPTADTRHVAGIFLEGSHDGVVAAQARFFDAFHRLEDALVIFGHDLDEFRDDLRPLVEHSGRARAAGVSMMTLNHFP